MSSENNYIIVQILQGFLGQAKGYDSSTKKQWQFNCPSVKCKNDVDKFNLEYNTEKHLFNCWKCGYKGFVSSLAKDYGSEKDSLRIKSFLPKQKYSKFEKGSLKKEYKPLVCKLPEGYIPLGKKRNSSLYNLAWNYLVNERKVGPNLIDRYEIGYTESGGRKFRIIIPSKNFQGKINYYEARSYIKGKKVVTYMKPPSSEVAKNDIIFNEYYINWDIPVFLVEGVFDMFRIPNSIPVLGKEISQILIDKLLKNNSTVIICFDPDAFEKTIETFNLLNSLGLNVFFVDLQEYNKNYIKRNPQVIKKESDVNLISNRDISKIYEECGQEEVFLAIKNIKKIDLEFEVNQKINKI